MSSVTGEIGAEQGKPGRRERRAREMRQRILQAAVELFGERGVDAVTVDEIAERADVARGTVFNYFGSKDILCGALGSIVVDRVEEAIEQGRLAMPGAARKIEYVMQLMSDVPLPNADRFRELLLRGLARTQPGQLPEHRRREFELLEGWVREGQENGEFRSDFASCELAGYILGLHFQACIAWAYGFIPGTLTEYTMRVLQLALEGIQCRDRATSANTAA